MPTEDLLNYRPGRLQHPAQLKLHKVDDVQISEFPKEVHSTEKDPLRAD